MTAPADHEPPYGWVVVGAAFTALAVIFGISYSFAAFFESFADDFRASRAEVSLVFGLSGWSISSSAPSRACWPTASARGA